ncbi:hypothetical protein GYMLUDRAFT_33725 [Collybiopsis luxurians FD-317 M1]|nr:hypothetical protein GYMLUDRAFT_33725 [Collybiopsis luxurians FD-317 M1]
MKSRPRLTLLVVLVVMFLIATADLILVVLYFFVQLPTLSFDPPDINETLLGLAASNNILFRLNFVISDGIVIWRAWILFPYNFTVKFLLSLCMLGSVVCALVDGGTLVAGQVRNDDPLFDFARTKELLLTLPLLITNLLATCLIAYKAWRHRLNLRRVFSSYGSSSSRVQNVLMLLMESGFLYCGIWIAYTAVILSVKTLSIPFQIYTSVMPIVSAIYPVLIILLTSLERSDDESEKPMTLSQSIRFAGTTGSATDTITRRHDTVMEHWSRQSVNLPATASKSNEGSSDRSDSLGLGITKIGNEEKV